MLELKKATLKGNCELVAAVGKAFGEIVDFQVADFKEGDAVLTVTHALPNIYTASGDKEAKLYVLVPDRPIECIWPRINECGSIKLGCASKKGRDHVRALAISSKDGKTVLYFCLTPDGDWINGTGALGI